MTQESALTLMKMGYNAYLTGPAGSGKTHCLRSYITWLREHNIPVAVTASTGIAATHLAGQTIHSWSGIGIKDQLTEYDLDMLLQKEYLVKRIAKAKVLIIDEISMLTASILDGIDAILRGVHSPDKPFGGVQVILSGDFFQLPPISRGDSLVQYTFESTAWQAANFAMLYLESQYRTEDQNLFALLSAIRSNRVDTEVMNMLSRRQSYTQSQEEMTQLFTHNVQVDEINNARLNDLEGELRVYEMSGSGRKPLVETLKKSCLAPEQLRVKIDAEVMFVKNDPTGLYVNGTRGRVIDFTDGMPVVETREGSQILVEEVEWPLQDDGGKQLAVIRQVPLRLAWAITVHKSQGMTLDEVYTDLSSCFVPGQGYVALSRVRNLEGLCLGGFNDIALQVDDRIVEVDKELRQRSARTAAHLTKVPQEKIEEKIKERILSQGGSLKADKSTPKASAEKSKKVSTITLTGELLDQGKTCAEVAKERDLAVSTIIGHAEQLLQKGVKVKISEKVPKKILTAASKLFDEEEKATLTPVREKLAKQGIEVDYDTLKLARLLWLSGK